MSRFTSAVKKTRDYAVARLYADDAPLIRWYYRRIWKPRTGLSAHLDALSRSHDHVFFIQAGANDGLRHDPLCKFIKRDRWKGILVEPQKEVFRQLDSLHRKSPGIICVNAAIAEKEGEKNLYKISFSRSRWATGLASFDKATVQKHIDSGHVLNNALKEGIPLPKNPQEWITTEKVRCVTIPGLVREFSLPRLDLLQVDTEGFDHIVIQQADIGNLKPEIISFENAHIPRDAYASLKCFLTNKGYAVEEHGNDTVARRKPPP